MLVIKFKLLPLYVNYSRITSNVAGKFNCILSFDSHKTIDI